MFGIGWKVSGTLVVDDWPVGGLRKTVGEDEGAAILVTGFKRLLRKITGGVVVGG